VRAPAGFDRRDPVRRQRVVSDEELGVFPGENIVGHDGKLVGVAQGAAQRQQERGLSAANRSADADGERPCLVVPADR
jgi:hypothetical protein